ncbi:aromatic prenyltransferase [Aspergillus fijiensis CBS 313.89]|uniref:Aromatic prenyltransferase n=1 Tax=Aspergillus fijiensis CBS 313.89 TaxID=1448319 RepID=A0A8G1RKL5_9EURO|nr:aromatic prenyltransferase [Aspergillus fijiensis CBS 313.89]RAK75020.1 aromatic prenyltransferase [Aspergillus fijiensis CBS 313.89]
MDTTLRDARRIQTPKSNASDNPWDIIVQYPTQSPNPNELKWWKNIAPLMGRLLQVAHYPLSQQYQYLLFLRNQLVPFLGPYPHQWRSLLTITGHPFEMSLNFQGKGSASTSTVRLTMEPIGPMTDTAHDRFNQVAAAQISAQVAAQGLGAFDMELHRQIMGYFAISGEEQQRLVRDYAFTPHSVRGTYCMGFDFLSAGAIAAKGYAFLGVRWKLAPEALGATVLECLERMHARTGAGNVAAARMAVEYMEAGKHFTEFNFLGWDYADAATSRLKLYGLCGGEEPPSLKKAEHVWTLGGKAQGGSWCEKGLELLRRLWAYLEEDDEAGICCCGRHLAQDSEEEQETHRRDCLARQLLVLAWNYETHPDRETPLPKMYLSLHRKNDLFVAKALARFFQSLGWEDKANTYVDDLQYVFAHEDLSQTTRIHSIVSLAYTEEKGAYVSMYYHSCMEYGTALVE